MAKHPAEQLSGELSRAQLDTYARLYSAALMRYFTKRGCQKATVDDLVQNVMVRLAARASGEEIKKPESYIMRTASNVWCDFMRNRQTHSHKQHVEYDESNHAVPDFSAEDTCSGQETIQLYIEALKTLPPHTRQVFMLCRYEGMRQSAVATRLGVSKSYVSKHMVKAIAYLATRFGDER